MQTFNEYQKFTQSLASYNTKVMLVTTNYNSVTQPRYIDMNYMYPLLALAEETGEVAGKVAKFVRKSLSEDVNTDQLREDIKKELGDLQYQVSETARQFGFTLQEIVDGNVEKLQDRADRGVIVGEGDNR